MKNRTLRWIGAVALLVLSAPMFAQLSGSYTIDPNGSGTNNYTSFTSAISALSTSGVSGAVTFNVKQGTYTEQVTIPSVTGASATNKITFQADPTNTAAATVTYSPTGTADNWTIRLNGCSNITIKGLTITSGGTTYGRLVDYTGSVGNISILDNTFDGVAGTSTSSYFAGMYYTSPAEAQGNWNVSGNTMNAVSYAIYVYGSSYTTSMDSIFIENNVINTTYYGLYPRYAKYQKVHGNTINATGTYAYNYLYYPLYGVDVQNNTINAGTGYGFYIYTSAPSGYAPYLTIENNTINAGTYGIYASCSGTSTGSQWAAASIKKNNIVLSGTTNYGIYLNYANFPSTAPGIIENNMIASNGTGSIYAIYPYHCANTTIQHNSVNVSAGSTTAGRAVYLNASTSTSYFTPGGNVIKNNIFVNAGGGYAIEASSTAAAGTYFTSDNNNYYGTSTTPFGPGSSTLSAWQTASSQDANSVWGDPLFTSATDLHVQGSAPNNAGAALGVATDIDGDTRSTTTPDMGADEYAPLTCFGVSGLSAANVSDVSFDATWSSNNSTTIAYQVRYRETGSSAAYMVQTGSTSIAGLMSSTSYDFSVREVCSVGDTCSWSADATVTTAACALSNQCQYTIYMGDTYGDGWNGNVVTFTQSGNVNATATFTSGSSAVATLGLCSWDSVSVDLGTLGSFSYECFFTVTNANGDTVLTHGSGTTLTANYHFGDFLPVCTACPPADMCAFTVNMTDAYGDGWNGNTVSFIQNGYTVGTVGGGFTSGSSYTETIMLCDGVAVTAQVGTLGLWTGEVGFTVVDPDGNTKLTRASGTTFTASTVFGTFTAACSTPSCPVTDTLSIASQTSCGPSSVTFTASPATATNTVVWLNSDSVAVGNGNSYTTGAITANTDYYATVFADDNQANAISFGPSSTLTGGFGNFTNGMWFSVQKPMSLDSISVVSNGLVNFQVRISTAGGAIATGNVGTELIRSNPISVTAAGTHQVAVGLTLMPGTYFMNMAFLAGTTGALHRATAGGSYPYTAAGVASIDSVQFGSATSQVRVYYAYDWVVSEGCVGPVSTASAIYAPVPSTAIPYSVDFNSGIPCNWIASSTTSQNWAGVTSYGASSLNGTAFVMIDDDAAGSSAGAVDAALTSPIMNAMGYDTLTVEFDHYWRSYTGTTGYVEVYDGTNWVTIDTMTATRGSWTAPAHEMYNVTMYQNADFQARLRYVDATGTWGWYWAVDNFLVDGALTPCTNVRVEVLTDIYGSETSWYIKDINTGVVWATGGPYADVSPYNAAAALHVDTVCIPDNGTYEFRINDSFGDGLDDGTNAGWYQVDILCPWGDNRVATIDTTLTSVNGAPWGAFHYGSTTNAPMYDSTVFTISCVQYTNVTFQVDMNKVTQGFTTPEVNGTWNNWCGSCNAMSDANGDNIWEVTLPLEQGTTVEFKYSADGWSIQEMNDPTASCTNGNATYTNRVLTIPASDTIIPVVCWSSCDACSIEVTLNVNMAWEVANGAVSTDGIHVAGSFQGWSPSTTEMTDPDGDGIYSVTLEMPLSQDLFYKFINGNDWAVAEASGDLAACGVSDGFGGYNRHSVTANADTNFAAVCFTKCYDCAVSIDEALGNISLYPNPTSGAFTMERSELAGNIEVTVIGLQGQLLLATEWTAGQSELNIDLSDLAAGVYMVRLTAEEGTRTLRVAVQR